MVATKDSLSEGKEGKTPSIENVHSELNRIYQTIDKAVTAGVIHKNKSARLKSRLTLAFNQSRQKRETPAGNNK
jgi:ribosomal protein S20